MLASFDIFDTVLIRKCGDAKNVFWLLARRLYPDDAARREDFFLWRRQIEEKSKAKHLTDFYKDASELFPPYSEVELAETELAVESEQLVANPVAKDAIDGHRAAGDAICFISDMYLPSDFLSSVLRREVCLSDDERVFVSCEWNARKDTGELYEVVRRELKPSEWTHYGDNAQSDIRMARRHAISAKRMDTSWTGVEQLVLNASTSNRHPQYLSVLAGQSRAIRLKHSNRPEQRLAADYLAPAYIPYVHWLLLHAKMRGIQRLYFLSRDGWILRNIAEAMDTLTEFRDLFLSRKALTLPWLCTHFDEKSLLRLVDGHTLLGRRFDDILSLLKLNLIDLAEFGITYDHDRIASRDEEAQFLSQLFSGECGKHIKEQAASARGRLLAYLKQENVGQTGVQAALVDIGWLGTTRLMLNDVLNEEGLSSVRTFYFAVRQDCNPCANGCYEAFFPDGTLSTDLTTIIENYFSASIYPSTQDYVEENGIWQPEWMKKNFPGTNPLAKVNCNTVCEMAREIVQNPHDDEALFAWARVTLDEVCALSKAMDLSPLKSLSDFDGIDFVRRLSLLEVIRLVFFGRRITAWDNASLALSVGFCLKRMLWAIHLKIASRRRLLYKFFFRLFA